MRPERSYISAPLFKAGVFGPDPAKIVVGPEILLKDPLVGIEQEKGRYYIHDTRRKTGVCYTAVILEEGVKVSDRCRRGKGRDRL